jgi:hypothetical protein
MGASGDRRPQVFGCLAERPAASTTGSDCRASAAATFSLTSPCRRLGVEPWAYLQDVLTRLPTMPVGQFDDLLPDHRQEARQAKMATPAAPAFPRPKRPPDLGPALPVRGPSPPLAAACSTMPYTDGHCLQREVNLLSLVGGRGGGRTAGGGVAGWSARTAFQKGRRTNRPRSYCRWSTMSCAGRLPSGRSRKSQGTDLAVDRSGSPGLIRKLESAGRENHIRRSPRGKSRMKGSPIP